MAAAGNVASGWFLGSPFQPGSARLRVLAQGLLLKYTSTKSLPAPTFKNGYAATRKAIGNMRQHKN